MAKNCEKMKQLFKTIADYKKNELLLKNQLNDANDKIQRLKLMVNQELTIIGSTKDKINKYKMEILTSRDLFIKEKHKNKEMKR